MNPALHAQLACLWEATARKVGNVHPQRDFADLRYVDFLLSAAAIGPAFAKAPNRPVGEFILEVIEATRRVVRTNTNLGIVLLLAPLASVPASQPLAAGLEQILSNLTVADSRNVFAAIRLACPGGLGEVPREDVHQQPTLPLREVMALAADRDLVARQYMNGFREVLHVGVPRLRDHLAAGEGLEDAIILTHLHFLAQYPDSLIARKHGLDVAKEATRRARAVLELAIRNPQSAIRNSLDAWLCDGRNPGTSADLVTACLFVALRERIITLPLDVPWSRG